jgi:hypothetical protein
MQKYKVIPGERLVQADGWGIDEAGNLIFDDEEGNLVIAFAPGAWRTVERVYEVDAPDVTLEPGNG